MHRKRPIIVLTLVVFAIAVVSGVWFGFLQDKQIKKLVVNNFELKTISASQSAQIATLNDRLSVLENEDQRKRNNDLEATIKEIQKVFGNTVSVYEDLVDIKILSKNTAKFDESYAKIISLLVEKNYASASGILARLATDIKTEKEKVTAVVAPVANVPANNSPPGSGYSRQSVSSGAGNFVVSLVAADLGNTKVIVDTASDGDCSNNCPALPLATFVSRSGAFAGINGSYFCPPEYPTCVGKTNSFDLLVMNKNKTYFNSGNNVYSSNPAVIFGSGYVRFVSAASEWGRDTGVDGVLSNYPLLLQGGNVRFGGDSDPKKGSRGNRSFVGNKGNTVYIGVVHSATVAESALVLKSLGLENALNLDDGGSTALWSGGYKLGPGRNLPNAILFVRK